MKTTLEMILSKLRIENAKDNSNEEIERILSHCIMPTKLIKLAKKYKSEGLLNL